MICASGVDNLDQLWDVIIVGAGVAGAMAAWGSAKQGHRVLLLDKAQFPRGKTCGCCLNHASVELLAMAGFNALSLGAIPIRLFHLACKGLNATLKIPTGLALSREKLDTELIHHAVGAGAVFMPRAAAEHTEAYPAHRVVRIEKDGIKYLLRAKLVIAADGLGGRLLRTEHSVKVAANSRIGMACSLDAVTNQDMKYDACNNVYEAGIIYMACGQRGYAGLVRVEGGRLHIAVALDVDAVRRTGGAGAAVEHIIRESGLTVPDGLAACRWHGTPPLTQRRERIAAARLFVLGDAVGYVEPFTGEGMAWALAGAHAIMPLVRQAVDQWRPELERQWQQLHRKLLLHRQGTCRTMAGVLRYQRLTRLAVGALRLAPQLAGPWMSRLNKPYVCQ